MHSNLKKLSGCTTVPNSYIGGKHFGGDSHTLKGIQDGTFE